MKNILFVALILFSLIGCRGLILPTEGAKPDKTIIDNFSNNNDSVGILVLMRKNDSVYTYSSGYSDFENKLEMNENNLFEIGSATKIFTAIAILQLIEDGKLSLNTTLNTIYPNSNVKKLANFKGENYWDKVTIKMLLNHSSGFIDYLNIYESDEAALEIFKDVNKVYSFNDIIESAINHGDANFKPGKKFKYSNTNYIVLGDIISKVSKIDWRAYIHHNIFDKAELENTFFGSKMSQENKKRLALGHYQKQVKSIPYTLAGSAGEIVSNIYDMDKFLRYWEKGKFFKNSETFTTQITTGKHRMIKISNLLKYALGSILIDNTAGHAGQTFGFQSYLAIDTKTKNTYVIGINNSDVDCLSLFSRLLGNEYLDEGKK